MPEPPSLLGDFLVLELKNGGNGLAQNMKMITTVEFSQNLDQEGSQYTEKLIKIDPEEGKEPGDLLNSGESRYYIAPTELKFTRNGKEYGISAPYFSDGSREIEEDGLVRVRFILIYEDILDEVADPLDRAYSDRIEVEVRISALKAWLRRMDYEL